jgi:hypothetical protein
MIDSYARSDDGQTFTLSNNGEHHTYSNNKEGKRQAIIDGLNAIKTITVGDDMYLPHEAALQVVAAILYPDGIQTEKAYEAVCRTTEKACVHLGYGDEVQLSPPLVPFPQRGSYRQKRPPLDAQFVLNELSLSGTSSTYPQQELICTILWNKAGIEIYGKRWHDLSPTEQNHIQAQVDTIAQQAGWNQDDNCYFRPLSINEVGTRERLAQLLRNENGRPVSVSNVIYQTQLGAYGRGFYERNFCANDLTPALQAIIVEMLQTHNYDLTPEDGEYRPLPVAIAPEAEASMDEKIAALSPVMTELGQALLLQDLLTAVIGRDQAVSEWQAEELVCSGRVSQALRQCGYQTELAWLQPYHFQPRLDGAEARQAILKEVRVLNNPDKKLSLAKGLPIHTPAVVLDNDNDNIVYLEMVGHKQSVRANWAALVGKKVCWIRGKRVYLEGMKAHVLVKSSLSCGWVDHILIHKQASIREMNPEEPFFLLDDGQQSIPPLFYPMLNKCLAVPVLEDWAGYLWENGRSRNLITLLNDGRGQGYAAWRVLPAPDVWQELVQIGLQQKVLHF